MIGAIIGDIAGSRFEFDRSPKTLRCDCQGTCIDN